MRGTLEKFTCVQLQDFVSESDEEAFVLDDGIRKWNILDDFQIDDKKNNSVVGQSQTLLKNQVEKDGLLHTKAFFKKQSNDKSLDKNDSLTLWNFLIEV